MKKNKLSRLFSSKLFLIIISVLLALSAWIAVVITISPEQTRTIYNVPVKIPESGASYQALGLDVVTQGVGELTVNVTVVGERNVIGALSRDSFTVTPIFTSVENAGSYELSLQVTKNTQTLNYTIKSISPQSVTLEFATVTSKTFKVEAVLSSLTAPDGYILYTSTSLPTEVTVTASDEALARVARAVAVVSKSGSVTESFTESCSIVLLDEAGETLDLSAYKLDSETVDITVPIYKQGTVALKVEFSNVPDGFDIESLAYVLSVNEISVAAGESVLANLTTKTVGYIDLTTLTFGETYTFAVSLGTGVVNLDNITEVTVTLPQGNLVTKKLNVSDIRFENGTDQYTYILQTSKISGVTVIGPSSEVQNISAGSIVAVVDISSLALERGQNTVPVRFEIPSSSQSWVVGSYTVIVEVIPN